MGGWVWKKPSAPIARRLRPALTEYFEHFPKAPSVFWFGPILGKHRVPPAGFIFGTATPYGVAVNC